MSELAFRSNPSSTVPTQESIISDTLAAWEHEEFAPENITTSEKITKKRTSTSKNTKRKQKQSVSPKESFLSETSENSINYSAIQSAVLLPNASTQTENNVNHQVPNYSQNSTNFSNEASIMNQTSVKLNYARGIENNCTCQSSFSSIRSGESSLLNSTYITSQNSSLVRDSSSNHTVGELAAPLISSTQRTRKKVGNISLPNLSQEGKNKILNVPPKDVKKRAAKGPAKTKTKGTQVNIKTKAPKKNPAPKKRTAKKAVGRKMAENNNEKQENVEHIEASIRENIMPENDLNVNLGNPSDYEIKSKEAILKEKVEELLNMPSTSHAIPDINNTIRTVDDTISSIDPDQSGSEILISQSCSIEIIKDANRASKINIILPPETNLSLSKNNSLKSKKNVSNKVKKDSLTADNDDTPKGGKIKIKQEKPSPKSIDSSSEDEPIKNKHEKKDVEEKRRHSRRSLTPKSQNKKHRKASPAPKTKKQTIACGYMSSGSSDETDESYDSSEYSSSSCSCSDCVCDYSSCSCSSYSESSYDSPPRRRYHR